MTAQVTGDFSKAKELIEKLKASSQKAVYVGFPAEFNEKVDGSDSFNLASLAAVLEFGNERIPSRPFLRQTLAENQKKYIELFAELINKGFSIEQAYQQIALIAQGDVQQGIVNGDWVANAKSTIKRKGSSKPLIDTGKMRQSVRGIVK
jgi:hypothetical protein|nr:MAG TPA: virion morphogenesis protein [Caudoviricetes sp.]